MRPASTFFIIQLLNSRPLLELRLLNAEYIRVRRSEIIQKSFCHTGPQPVYIPRNHFFHAFYPPDCPSFRTLYYKRYAIYRQVKSTGSPLSRSACPFLPAGRQSGPNRGEFCTNPPGTLAKYGFLCKIYLDAKRTQSFY